MPDEEASAGRLEIEGIMPPQSARPPSPEQPVAPDPDFPGTPIGGGPPDDGGRAAGHAAGAYAPKAFIAYARDDKEHVEAVRKLYHLLAENGIDPVFDLPAEETPRDWTIWAGQVFTCEYVLVIASPQYKVCDEGRGEAPEEDARTRYAARFIRTRLFKDPEAEASKILGVVLPGRSRSELPNWLGPGISTPYIVGSYTLDGIRKLLRALLEQPYEVETARKPSPDLPARRAPGQFAGTSRLAPGIQPPRSSAPAAGMAKEFTRAIRSFEGRDEALAELVQWLSDDDDCRSRCVTSDPGSGKTALLGVLAHLGIDERYRLRVRASAIRHLPPNRSIDLGLFVGGMVAPMVLERLADAAGMETEDVRLMTLAAGRDTLLDHLRRTGQRLTILLDGLDEVVSPEAQDDESPAAELEELCRELLVPMMESKDKLIRFLLGCRRNVLSLARFKTHDCDSRVIDLDEDPYLDREGLTRRVSTVLRGDPTALDTASRRPSPWTEASPAFREAAVERIVSIADRSFQLGEAIARSQAGLSELPGALTEGWWQALPTHAGTAMRAELASRLPHDLERAIDLLRPLAYARGGGMPWADVWLPLANALKQAGNEPYTDADLSWIREHASSYVMDDSATCPDRPLFSLYHQLLGAYLRHGRNAAADEQTIFERLSGMVGEVPRDGSQADESRDDGWIGRNWNQAEEYVRSYLLEHALAGGRSRDVDALVLDPGLLAHARDSQLRSALGKLSEPGHRAVAETYRNASVAFAARLGDESLASAHRSPGEIREFLAQISLAARCAGVDTLAERVHLGMDADQAPWRAAWASWRRQPPHLRLSGHLAAVRATATGTLRDGRQVVVTAGDDGDIRIWDLLRGSLVHRIEEAHSDGIGGLTVGRLLHPHDRSIIVSVSDDRTARVWDLNTYEPVGRPFEGHQRGVRAVTLRELDGDLIVVSAGEDGVVRVWDPITGTERTCTELQSAVTALAVIDVENKATLLSADDSGQVLLWDLSMRQPQIRAYPGDLRPVRAVVTDQLDGSPLAISAGDDERIHVWDPLTRERRYDPVDSRVGRVRALAVAEVEDDHPLIVSGGDRGVQVWDLRTGRPLGAPFTGHTGSVRTLSVVRAGDRVVVISGGDDRTPRVWDLTSNGPEGDPFAGHGHSVRALHFAQIGGRNLVVSGSRDATVRQWDPDTGAQIGLTLAGHQGQVNAVTTAVVAGQPCILSAGRDGTVRLWDAASGDLFGKPFDKHGRGVTALLMTTVRGATRAVSATVDGEVLVWDPQTHVVQVRYAGHEGAVRALCRVSVAGYGPLIVSAGDNGWLHIWDPANGQLYRKLPSGLRRVAGLASIAPGTDEDGPGQDPEVWIAAGGDDGVVCLHDLSELAEPPRTWDTQAGPIGAMAMARNGASPVVVSGHESGAVRFRSMSGRVAAPVIGPCGEVLALAVGIVRGRPAIFSGGTDRLITTWDVERAAPLTEPHRGWVRSVAATNLASGEFRVVSGSDDDTIQIRGLDDGRIHGRPLIARQRGVRALTISDTAAGPVIVSAGADNAVRVFDLDQSGGGRLSGLRRELAGHQEWVRALGSGTLRDHPVVVSTSGDGTVSVWDLDELTLASARRTEHIRSVRAIAVAELVDENTGVAEPAIISGGADSTVHVTWMATGRPFVGPFSGHRATVRALGATRLAGTDIVISGDISGTALAWDVRTHEKQGDVPHGSGEISAIAAYESGELGHACTWVAVAAGPTITLSSWTEDRLWQEVAKVSLSADVLAVDMVKEYWQPRRPGRLVVGATHGVIVLEIAKPSA